MTIEKDYTEGTEVLFEKNIAIGGYTYLVIFGVHINGGFICIPNFGVGCEASDFKYQVGFNQDKMIKAGLNEEAAKEIALYIDSWLQDNSELMQQKREAAQSRMNQMIFKQS